MEGLFSLKTLMRLVAVAVVLAAVIVLVSERIENSRPSEVSAQREVTRLVERTVLVTQIVERLITPTAGLVLATPTAIQPLPTAAATETPAPLALEPGVSPQGVNAWCQPRPGDPDSIVIPITGSTGAVKPPENALHAAWVEDVLTVTTQVQSCTFSVAFSPAFPAGARLQVQDMSPVPFVDVELAPLEGDPLTGSVTLDHPYVVDPPYWQVIYTVSVLGPDGALLWQQPVNFKRAWQPQPCPDGGYPDPQTMSCP